MTDDLNPGTMSDEQLASLMQPDAEVPGSAPEPDPILAEALAEPPPAEEPKQETKHVPLAELLEERGRRKEAQARMDEMERRFQEYQARTQEYLAQRQAQPQPQPEAPPVNYNDDPIEYLRQQQEAVAANLQMLHQQQQEFLQRQQAERHWSSMRNSVGQAEAEFAKVTPDYYEAVNFLKEQRKTQLLQAGAPPQQVDALIARDAIAVANEAASLAMSPAEYAYRIAIGKGYTPKQVQKAVEAATAIKDAPKSLGGASGRAEPQTPSLKDVSKMSDTEFNKLFDKLMVGT
jgi:hypothetical protein